MGPTDPQHRRGELESSGGDRSELRFSAGRFEDPILEFITISQLSIGVTALLTLGVWFLAAPSDSGDWYLGVLALALLQGAAVYLLQFCYE